MASIIPNSAVLLRSIEDGLDMLTNEKVENIAYHHFCSKNLEWQKGMDLSSRSFTEVSKEKLR